MKCAHSSRVPLRSMTAPWLSDRAQENASAADEAMLITANVQGARYLGIQIVDMWMISYDYRDHVSSMTQGQAVPDADGRIRATFDIVWLAGWSPDASQPKPLKPGSAKMSLEEAVKKAGEK